MTAPVLELVGLTKSFGGVKATDAVSLEVKLRETLAVIGPNGAGKTTLIAQLCGSLPPDAGTIRFAGRDIVRLPAWRRSLLGLARSFQITSLLLGMSVLDNVALAVQAHQGHSFRFWAPARGDEGLVRPAMQVLEQIGLAGRAHVLAGALSHGERRQLEVAMALAGKPSLLVLDEPMAGMGTEETARMIALLRQVKRSCAILLVEHDMDAVFALADRISVLVYGRIIASGRPEEIRASADVRRAYLGEA